MSSLVPSLPPVASRASRGAVRRLVSRVGSAHALILVVMGLVAALAMTVNSAATPAVAAPEIPAPAVASKRLDPPTVWFDYTATTYAATQLVTINWCDDLSLVSVSRYFTLNGTPIGVGYDPGSYGGCAVYASTTITVNLNMGANTLYSKIRGDNFEWGEAYATIVREPPPAVITVSPDGGAAATVPPGVERRATFTIANTGGQPANVALTAVCSGAGIDAATCTASTSRLNMIPGASTPVTVRYTTQQAAGTGTITLNANPASGGAVLDAGYVNVTVSAPSLAIVQIAPSTGGVTLEKDQCTNFALRREASAVCGVLRVAHPLPPMRYRASTRAPTLLYHYDQAYRQRTIGVDVTMAPTTTYQAGDEVRVTVRYRVAGVCVNPATATKTYSAAHWFTGTPGARARRVGVSVPLETSGDSFIRQYCVDAERIRGGTPTALAPTLYGEFAVVQRYNTAFGAGWWLGGLEELYLNQPDSIGGANAALLWIGGDGSTRRYRCRPTGCNGIYLSADPIDRPDSVVLSGAEYTRYEADGVKVVFDNTGRHIRTVNRHGIMTTFAYSGATRRLVTIDLPPNGSGLAYTFVYDGSNSLIRVDVPGAPSGTVRSVTLQRSGLAVTGLTDPDNKAVTFLPAAGNSATLIERVTDKRGVATDYYRETWSEVLGSVRTVLSPGNEQWQWFQFPLRLSTAPATTAPEPDSLGLSYLRTIDGRGNVTKLWLDRLGFPTKIVNAVGQTTRVERGDPRFAGLVTNVVSPNGHTVSAAYDSHGNVVSSYDINPLGTNQDAITRYHWDLQWDKVDSIVTPVGLVTVMDYDNANGNLLWQQTGPDATRRVNFEYYTSGIAIGLPKGVKLPATQTNAIATDSLVYDVRGNPITHKTAMGFQTQFFNDHIGRTYETWEQVDVLGTARTRRTNIKFDAMSRDTMTVTFSSDSTAPKVSVRRTLDAAGNDSIITRWATPDPAGIGSMVTQTFRDALGRPVKQVAPDGHVDSTWYDLAGNVIKTKDRNGDTLVFAYDSLNRLRRRATALKHFAPETIGLARGASVSPDPVEAALPGQQLSQSYPWGRPLGYDIPAQVDTFVYHPTDGTLTDANNAFAKVHYEYYPNGAKKVERNEQAPWDGGAGPWHVYADTVSLDLAGRRTAIKYPTAISSGVGVTYSYNAFGDLSAMSALASSVTFTVDARGQLLRRDFPGSQSHWFAYDNDGKLTNDSAKAPSIWLRAQKFTYDARGLRTRMTDIFPGYGAVGSDTSEYNLLGQLTRHQNGGQFASFTNTNYSLDALGNMTSRSGGESSIAWVNGDAVMQTTSNNGEEWNWYHPATGRLWYTKNVPNADTTGEGQGGGGRPAMMNRYDNAGNLIWTGMAILRLNLAQDVAAGQTERRMYYGPDGKLRATEARAVYTHPSAPESSNYRGFSRSFEEYRYDALGRRVATRFDQECDSIDEFNRDNAPCHLQGIRRTIWDGSQELGEIQLPAEQIENDTYVGQGTYNSGSINLAPFFGAVAYAYDGRIDQPVAIRRLRYSNLTPSNTIVELAAFTYHPLWNIRGSVPYVFPSGALPAAVCDQSIKSGMRATCFSWVTQHLNLAFRDMATLWPRAWQGSLLEDKVGAGGLMYRRNRYYDSKSGRFTQEDPIGLAGGLNLYGYAGGDPINHSDPFGLCVLVADCPLWIGGAIGAAKLAAFIGAAIATAWALDKAAARDRAVPRAIDRTRTRVDIHHIATDKNSISEARGGPWTPQFEAMFAKAGMSMNDPSNVIPVVGHRGPHPEAYHRAVYDALSVATEGKSGREYQIALRAALGALAVQIATPGTPLNVMVTGGK